MKKQLSKLLDLKSIVTITLTVALVAIIFTGTDIRDEGLRTLFVSVVSSVFTYYFSRKESKNDGGDVNGGNT